MFRATRHHLTSKSNSMKSPCRNLRMTIMKRLICRKLWASSMWMTSGISSLWGGRTLMIYWIRGADGLTDEVTWSIEMGMLLVRRDRLSLRRSSWTKMMKYQRHSIQTSNEAISRSKTVSHLSSKKFKRMFLEPSHSILNVVSTVTETTSLVLVRSLKTLKMSRRKVKKTSKM